MSEIVALHNEVTAIERIVVDVFEVRSNKLYFDLHTLDRNGYKVRLKNDGEKVDEVSRKAIMKSINNSILNRNFEE